MDQTPKPESAVDAALAREATAHRRKGVALLGTGLVMPAVFGVGAAVVAAVFDLGFRGMDDYVPLFVGALVGSCVGVGVVGAGLVQLALARRIGRWRG